MVYPPTFYTDLDDLTCERQGEASILVSAAFWA
jgi:hypothetical protein